MNTIASIRGASAAIIIGALAFICAPKASAQYVPTWEQTGLFYLSYVAAITYAQTGESLTPGQAAAVAGAYGANAGACAYWQEVASDAPEPYYDAGWVQGSYYRYYGANAAATAWPQGAEYQAFVYNYWSEYGSSIEQWYYDYAQYIYNYYSGIAQYYYNLIYSSSM